MASFPMPRGKGSTPHFKFQITKFTKKALVRHHISSECLYVQDFQELQYRVPTYDGRCGKASIKQIGLENVVAKCLAVVNLGGAQKHY